MSSELGPGIQEAVRASEAVSGEEEGNRFDADDLPPASPPESIENDMAEAADTPVVGDADEYKPVTLRTAPQDPRFPTTNQSRRCYVAYNEYYKCIKEKGKGSGDCKPHMRAFRSICPDEWIERWEELRQNGTWYGKY